MASPGAYSLDVYRGDSARWQFKLWLDAGRVDPVDLAGATAKAEIRDKPAGKKITALDCTITQPNIIDVILSGESSKALAISSGVWDLQLTYGSGDIATVVAGQVSVTADVTDSGA